MESRAEFVRLAVQEGANLSSLCRRFGISRKTGHKWLARHRAGTGLEERSRRPGSSPAHSSSATETVVLALRAEHPSWGGRKLRRRLQDLGHAPVPAASTITAILARHGRLLPEAGSGRPALGRFEHDRPNTLWQMDFKGHFALATGRCHPLTVLDDHSRYALVLSACANELTATVRDRLIDAFRRYGLPERINVDNGSPWGDGPGSPHTLLTVWLMRLGVRVSHSRPYHPQTNGKGERFHRTLKRDLLHARHYVDLTACQTAFDSFREVYNVARPHEALGLATPASRYRASPRDYPESLPSLAYDPIDCVRRVQQSGWISFRGHPIRIPKAFAGQEVAIRPTIHDGLWDIVFIAQTLAQIDLRTPSAALKPVTHVSEQV